MSTVSWKFAVALVVGGACLSSAAGAQVAVGRGIVEQEAPAGSVYRGSIPLSNGGGEARRVRIYPADYSFDAAGATTFGAPGSSPRSSARWVELGATELVVPAGRTVTVEYSVSVPASAPGSGARLEGSYWSVVMIEEIPGPAEARAGVTRRRPELGVQQVMRTAVVLVTHIAGTGAAELAFESPRVLREGDTRLLQVDVRNTGTRAVRPALSAELFDAGGRSHGKVRGIERMLYPGTSARYRFALGAAAAGRYTAVVLGDAGGDAVFGAQYGVSF